MSFTDAAWQFPVLADGAQEGLGGEAGLSEEEDGEEVDMPPIIGVGIIGRLGEAPGED